MNNQTMPDDLFIQFTAQEFSQLTYEDRLFLHNLKVSPRCNETRHRDCFGKCECTCHVPLAEKQAWMKKNLPSFKKE